MIREEWKTEPNEEQFVHAEHICILRRKPAIKVWSGFIQIANKHPWYGSHEAELAYVPVHGHINYSDLNPFHNDNTWWVGFSCDQQTDIQPFEWEDEGLKWPKLFKNRVYRNIDFAREQVMILADWARKAIENEAKGRETLV